MTNSERNDVTLTVLTPYWNEAEILPDFLAHIRKLSERPLAPRVQWILIDSWSSDRGPSQVDQFLEEIAQLGSTRISLYHLRPEKPHPLGPSIGRALNLVLSTSAAKGQWVQVLPADCQFTLQTFDSLMSQLPHMKSRWFACDKQYRPSTWSLKLHAGLQNSIRLGLFGRAVWTNAMGVSATLLREAQFPEMGFMEDSLWCDQLRGQLGRPAHFSSIEVSARRYYPNRILRRILTNAVVISLYRLARSLRVIPIERVLPSLRRIYLYLR